MITKFSVKTQYILIFLVPSHSFQTDFFMDSAIKKSLKNSFQNHAFVKSLLNQLFLLSAEKNFDQKNSNVIEK